VVGRAPSKEEAKVLKDLYLQEQGYFKTNPAKSVELLRTGDSPFNKKLPSDQLAAFTVVASTIMNFDEALIKR
jgi:predicted TIM-barrel enzyme